MKPGLLSGLAVAAALAGAGSSAAATPTQAGPEYGLLVSAIAGGLQATKPVFTCGGPDLTPVVEALGGAQAVRKLGLELVSQALGTRAKPWPRNHRAFTYRGRRWTPDFVKGNTFYLVETGNRLDLIPEIRDLQAVARARGGQLVVVTRRHAAVASALSQAASRWWGSRAGRVRILRCI